MPPPTIGPALTGTALIAAFRAAGVIPDRRLATVLLGAGPVISRPIICTFAGGTCMAGSCPPRWLAIAPLMWPLRSAGANWAIADGGRWIPISDLSIISIDTAGVIVKTKAGMPRLSGLA